jgi:hypothetical protein
MRGSGFHFHPHSHAPRIPKRESAIVAITISKLVEVDEYYIDPDTVIAEWEGKPRCLSAAISYAAIGWHVFPAPRNEKKSHKSADHSGGRKWGKTTDPNEIKRDFARWPEASVGIATGKDTKVWVVEADTPKGHSVDGIASIRTLEERHGPLPPTLMAESPSGSIHRYFNYPEDREIRNTVSGVAPGIDVRGEGGMVIAPPSVRGDGSYVWLNDLPVADAPEWLIERPSPPADPTATSAS